MFIYVSSVPSTFFLVLLFFYLFSNGILFNLSKTFGKEHRKNCQSSEHLKIKIINWHRHQSYNILYELRYERFGEADKLVLINIFMLMLND